jgi:predicted branched-subunit amino acid permease
MTTETQQTTRLTWGGLKEGALISLPFGASSIVYGLIFGLLASDAGLRIAEAVLMSALVFSGTAQIATLQMRDATIGLLPLFATVLIVNARYILQGAALRPWLNGVSPLQANGTLLFIVDGSFALGMREYAKGRRDVGLLLGSCLLSYTTWVVATGFGFAFGRLISDPKRYGLDFILVAFCGTAAAMMWRGQRDVLPLVAAAVAAALTEKMVGGAWAVVAAGLAGVVVGALRHGK